MPPTWTGATNKWRRLDWLVHHLGLVLANPPAACLVRQLVVPVSNDTLPRVVSLSVESPSVIGIDDWAWQRTRPHYRQISTTDLPDTFRLW
jgi:hypothetical protein